MQHILYCSACGQYTMKAVCPSCGKETISKKPPKFSPDDRFAAYRRQAKEAGWKAEGKL